MRTCAKVMCGSGSTSGASGAPNDAFEAPRSLLGVFSAGLLLAYYTPKLPYLLAAAPAATVPPLDLLRIA